MEAAGEPPQSLLDTIKPPRLEDAGLEDCALPPDSIREAFLKAASAVRSLVPGRVREEDDQENTSDALVGITEGVSAPSAGCATEKGVTELPEKDDVVLIVGGEEEGRSDGLIGVGKLPEVGDQSCVDGLLEIGGRGRGISGNSDEGSNTKEGTEEGGDKPVLVEGYV